MVDVLRRQEVNLSYVELRELITAEFNITTAWQNFGSLILAGKHSHLVLALDVQRSGVSNIQFRIIGNDGVKNYGLPIDLKPTNTELDSPLAREVIVSPHFNYYVQVKAGSAGAKILTAKYGLGLYSGNFGDVSSSITTTATTKNNEFPSLEVSITDTKKDILENFEITKAQEIYLVNTDSDTVYLGNDDSQLFPLTSSDQPIVFEVSLGASLFAKCASGNTSKIAIIRKRLWH